MLELTEKKVELWEQEIRAPSRALAEQDYRLTTLLAMVQEDEFLRDRLAFKGGTALNKLYFGDDSRLSVDLDFNVLGTRESVQGDRRKIQAGLASMVKAHDPGVAVSFRNTWELLRVTARYRPVTGAGEEKIKLELSMVERFPITKVVTKPISVPGGTKIDVRTYPLDELLATKLRAAYSRRKGRDLFDLDRGRAFIEDPARLRRMAVYYFFRAGMVYDTADIRMNLAEKVGNRSFIDEARNFIRVGTGWDAAAAADSFLTGYGFMFDSSAEEEEFLAFARRNLPGSHATTEDAGGIGHRPLSRLFSGMSGISDEALTKTPEDIRVVRSWGGRR